MPNEELKDLREELKRTGAALGLSVRVDETSVAFARRCTGAARLLRLGAGVTWADYELIKADKGTSVFGLKKPPESSPLGGPRWTITVAQGLDELAGQLGMYEDVQPSATPPRTWCAARPAAGLAGERAADGDAPD
jgi:hypothetical protein